MSENWAADIDKALGSHTEDRQVAVMLDICVGRILRKEGKREKDWTLQYKPESVDHIVEWLALACAENAHWLRNTSPDGKPKKLLKFATVQDVVKEADEFFRKRTANAPKQTGATDSEEPEVFAIGDGYRIVRMMSSTALDREGTLMQHCVGSGGYDEALRNDREMFFSLRDKRNNPHVTMQVRKSDKKVIQARGKQNAYPIPKYARMISDFAKLEGFDISGERVGIAEFRTPEGEVLDPTNLPEDRIVIAGRRDGWRFLVLNDLGIERWPRVVEVVGDVHMDFYAGEGPREVVVRGRLKIGIIEEGSNLVSLRAETVDIERREVEFFPPGTVITDSLLAKGSSLSRLNEGMTFSGTVDLKDTKVEKLPSKLTCGNLNIEWTEIKSLPKDLVVKGDLLATKSALRLLPRGLHIPGKLDISHTGVRVLPQGLLCGNLDISHTSIRKLPASTSIWSSLVADFSSLETLGAHDEFDTLSLRGTRLAELPAVLVVRGALDISDLPAPVSLAGVQVMGSIDADGSHITAFPSAICVANHLSFRGSTLARLPDDVSCEQMTLDGAILDALPVKPVVKNWISASGSTVTRVYDLSRVGGIVDLNDSMVSELPVGLEVAGSLWLERTPIRRLPDGLRIADDLNAAGSKLEELAQDIVIGRSANFLGSSVSETAIYASRLRARNIFDNKGAWVVGHDTSPDDIGWEAYLFRTARRHLRRLAGSLSRFGL